MKKNLMAEDVKFQVGKMIKEPRTMTSEEKEKWYQRISASAREYLFSIGQPLVYKSEDGHVVAEYQDGRISIVR
jgi:hypothetical protein